MRELTSCQADKIKLFINYKRTGSTGPQDTNTPTKIKKMKYSTLADYCALLDKAISETNTKNIFSESFYTYFLHPTDGHVDSPDTRNHRRNVYIGFLRFMVSNFPFDSCIDPDEIYTPPPKENTRGKVRREHIYTKDEIERFFKAVVDEIEFRSRGAILDTAFPLMLQILYCCGLRLSELLHLRLSDIHPKESSIMIENDKSNNTKVVPVDQTLMQDIVRFMTIVHKKHDKSTFLFIKDLKTKEPISSKMLREFFYNVCDRAGIKGEGGKRVRLHDFRHTFIVNSIIQAMEYGYYTTDFAKELSNMLGHKSMESTYYYIKLTKELSSVINATKENLSEEEKEAIKAEFTRQHRYSINDKKY